MSLLSVIFALLAENFINRLSELRRFEAFYRYVGWLRGILPTFAFQTGAVTLVILVSSILFVVWLISAMLGDFLGLFGFLFAIAVLIFSIGPRHLEEDTQNVIKAFENKDYEQANQLASKLSGRSISEPPLQLVQTVRESILLQANSALLGVFFWFIILGPVGAVLFRISVLLKDNSENETDEFAEASRDLYRIMIWLPARICVLSYAIAGNFVDTMSYWHGVSDLWLRDSEEFIIISGMGALRYDHSQDGQSSHSHGDKEIPDVHLIQQSLSLVKRALIVWVVLLALLTVTGWLV